MKTGKQATSNSNNDMPSTYGVHGRVNHSTAAVLDHPPETETEVDEENLVRVRGARQPEHEVLWYARSRQRKQQVYKQVDGIEARQNEPTKMAVH